MFYSIFDKENVKECPLIEGDCIQNRCAWWMKAGKVDDGMGSCAIAVSAHGDWIASKEIKSRVRPNNRPRVHHADENFGNR